MDTRTFDTLTRFVTTTTTTRRSTLRGLAAGVTAAVGGHIMLHADEAVARHKRKRKKKRRNKTPAPENICEGKNWCVDRSQTCGEATAHGKCLVEASGDNLCAEILYQTASCADCDPPGCLDCRCVLAAGGGDRCNNGANGLDFICVRPV